MKTLCKHCLNSCKHFIPNCKKYKTETVQELKEQKKKMNPEAIEKLNYLDYGLVIKKMKL